METEEVSTLTAQDIIIRAATAADADFAWFITQEMETSAKSRGTGISKRSPEAIAEKMRAGKAVIAFTPDGYWAGFAYLESYDNGRFVSNSGLIVAAEYRKLGIAAAIKQQLFDLCRQLYPKAMIFGITTGAAVMKINTRMGFEPVVYADITQDPRFWDGCKSCVNYPILTAKDHKHCLCTAMLYNPEKS